MVGPDDVRLTKSRLPGEAAGGLPLFNDPANFIPGDPLWYTNTGTENELRQDRGAYRRAAAPTAMLPRCCHRRRTVTAAAATAAPPLRSVHAPVPESARA
eukprot:2074856-Prymnesium_polylepis.1